MHRKPDHFSETRVRNAGLDPLCPAPQGPGGAFPAQKQYRLRELASLVQFPDAHSLWTMAAL